MVLWERLSAPIGGGGIRKETWRSSHFRDRPGPQACPKCSPRRTPSKGPVIIRVALVTDGRFSGATSGPCIGHVEMEAYNGGPIGAIQNRDIIEIDIPQRRLNVRLTEEEIKRAFKDRHDSRKGTDSSSEAVQGEIQRDQLL